jgi:hypothetical protein
MVLARVLDATFHISLASFGENNNLDEPPLVHELKRTDFD